MKITILADNYVDQACLRAEHGFACLVEANGVKILFDTGQGEALITNMKALDIPKSLDMIVLSHGHYDHTGGLSRFLDEVAEYSADIYASEKIFEKHLKYDDSEYSYIGIERDRSELESRYSLHLNSGLTEIRKDIFLSGPIGRYENFDADLRLYAETEEGVARDMFRDEQYLLVRQEGGLHIVTGCSHCGAVNLVKDAHEKFPGEKILSLTGGLHLFRSDDEQTEHVISFLERENIQKINTGHCTGLDACMQMKNRLGTRVSVTKIGMVLEI